MAMATEEPDERSPLAELAERGGWHQFDPPTEDQEWSDENIIGNWRGQPIRAGFEIETVRDDDQCLHKIYRTSKYDVHLKIETLGVNLAQGQIKVEEAEGYDD